MAVAVVMDFEGGTLEQYDEVVDRMGFAREGAGAPGGLFHWGARRPTRRRRGGGRRVARTRVRR
jgi:hypothetical protein